MRVRVCACEVDYYFEEEGKEKSNMTNNSVDYDFLTNHKFLYNQLFHGKKQSTNEGSFSISPTGELIIYWYAFIDELTMIDRILKDELAVIEKNERLLLRSRHADKTMRVMQLKVARSRTESSICKNQSHWEALLEICRRALNSIDPLTINYEFVLLPVDD